MAAQLPPHTPHPSTDRTPAATPDGSRPRPLHTPSRDRQLQTLVRQTTRTASSLRALELIFPSERNRVPGNELRPDPLVMLDDAGRRKMGAIANCVAVAHYDDMVALRGC